MSTRPGWRSDAELEQLLVRSLLAHMASATIPIELEAAAHAEQAFGGIDIVFANAGIQAFKPLLDMDDEHWQVQIENNLTASGEQLPRIC